MNRLRAGRRGWDSRLERWAGPDHVGHCRSSYKPFKYFVYVYIYICTYVCVYTRICIYLLILPKFLGATLVNIKTFDYKLNVVCRNFIFEAKELFGYSYFYPSKSLGNDSSNNLSELKGMFGIGNGLSSNSTDFWKISSS